MSAIRKQYEERLMDLLDRLEKTATFEAKNGQSIQEFDDEFKKYVKDENNQKDLYEMMYDFYVASRGGNND